MATDEPCASCDGSGSYRIWMAQDKDWKIIKCPVCGGTGKRP